MVQSLQQSSPEKKEQKANLFSFLRKCQKQECILNIQQCSLKLSARLLSHCWSRSQSFRLAQPLPITAIPPRAREPAPTHCRSRSRPGTSFSKIAATETPAEQRIAHNPLGEAGCLQFHRRLPFLGLCLLQGRCRARQNCPCLPKHFLHRPRGLASCNCCSLLSQLGFLLQ